MPRPLDTRLDRVEGQRIAAAAEPGAAAIRPALRAAAAMAAVIRSALARAGVDAANATRLAFAEEAAAPPAANPDTTKAQREDVNGRPLANADESPRADDFESKIRAMAQRFADGQPLDFANASFAELFAWSLARPEAGLPGPPDPNRRRELDRQPPGGGSGAASSRVSTAPGGSPKSSRMR